MPKRSAPPITSRIPGLRLAGRIAIRLADWLRSEAGTSFCGGMLAGLFGVAISHQMFARFGGGLMTSGGAAAAVAIGLLAATIGARRGGELRRPSLVAALIPAVWVLSINWLAQGVEWACHSFDLDALASPWGQFGAAFGAALLLLGIPAACAARVALQNAALDGFWVIAGAAVGCLTAAYGFGPWFGVQWAGLIAAGLTVAWAIRVAVVRWSAATVQDEIVEEPTSGLSAAEIARIGISSVAAGLTAASLGAAGPTTDAGNRSSRMDRLRRLPAGGGGHLAKRSPRVQRATLAESCGRGLGRCDRMCVARCSVPVLDGPVPRRHGDVLERFASAAGPWTRCVVVLVRRRCSVGRGCRWAASRAEKTGTRGFWISGSGTSCGSDWRTLADYGRSAAALLGGRRRFVAGDSCLRCASFARSPLAASCSPAPDGRCRRPVGSRRLGTHL